MYQGRSSNSNNFEAASSQSEQSVDESNGDHSTTDYQMKRSLSLNDESEFDSYNINNDQMTEKLHQSLQNRNEKALFNDEAIISSDSPKITSKSTPNEYTMKFLEKQNNNMETSNKNGQKKKQDLDMMIHGVQSLPEKELQLIEEDSNAVEPSSQKMSSFIDNDSENSKREEEEEELFEKYDYNTIYSSPIAFGEAKLNEEVLGVAEVIHQALNLRKKYKNNCDFNYPWEKPKAPNGYEEAVKKIQEDGYGNSRHPSLPYDPFDTTYDESDKSEELFEMKDGVIHVFAKDDTKHEKSLFAPPVTFEAFYEDYKKLAKIMQTAPIKAFCYSRLKLLELKFTLYKAINEGQESHSQRMVPHRDFYNVRKVDTHIHLSSSMNQKQLLRFIKNKLKTCPNEVVITRNGQKLTLLEVFKSLKLTAYDLSVDTLDVHADRNTLHRFDRFNLKYNPFGQSRLREIFLKTDNMIKGRYFGELVKEIMNDLDELKYCAAEYRVSIYGRKQNEWDRLSKWIINNKLYSNNVRWLIQIPRLFSVHKKTKYLKGNFQEMLDNIFKPLFETTRDPSSHPEVATFLNQVVAFDSVDDESKPEVRFHSQLPTPKEWNTDDNPPFAYYKYYFYANIHALNQYRKSKGLNTFMFRPHAGEAGDINHLIATYLLSDSISHGIELRKSPVLQYLYYMTQIGLHVAPLSNNNLFLNYNRNPFGTFFARGLNVSLSTDDPLQFHLSREPLIEEYSIAAQVWHFSATDNCEIARNSVLHSGWEPIFKMHYISQDYYLPGPAGNEITKTNVPDMRLRYRHETLIDEHLFIMKCLFLPVLSNRDEFTADHIPLSYKNFIKLLHRHRQKFEKDTHQLTTQKALQTETTLPLITPKELVKGVFPQGRKIPRTSSSFRGNKEDQLVNQAEGNSAWKWIAVGSTAVAISSLVYQFAKNNK